MEKLKMHSTNFTEENIEKIDDATVEEVLLDVEDFSLNIGDMEINTKELLREAIKTYCRMFIVIAVKKGVEKAIENIEKATNIENIQSILEQISGGNEE
jgi:Zn finger protein HypA/HybF involved in hydrogenase expression